MVFAPARCITVSGEYDKEYDWSCLLIKKIFRTSRPVRRCTRRRTSRCGTDGLAESAAPVAPTSDDLVFHDQFDYLTGVVALIAFAAARKRRALHDFKTFKPRP